MKRLLSYYHPRLPIFIAYMFQQVEYNPYKFLTWVLRRPDLTKIMHRQTLVWTHKAKALVSIIGFVWIFYITSSIFYLYSMSPVGIITFLIAPFLVIICAFLLVLFAWIYIEQPNRKKVLKDAKKRFEKHPGIKVAITGSYGKTTMKELLLTVLSEAKNVAATPGNKNVPISHAAWIKRLTGEEEILLIEYGEAAPGDIKKMAKQTHPDYGIVTGLAPNHLDEYKTLDAVAKDLLSIGDFVDHQKVYLDTTSSAWNGYDLDGVRAYSAQGLRGWKIHDPKVDYDGTSFELRKGKQKIRVVSGLLGRHQIPPLALVAVLSHDLGLSIPQIEAGLAKTQPFEHRMQARRQHGAWIIDDTYNGSLEGLRAGISLMQDLKAKRKIYVTPGLVDQGEETERVHLEIGKLLAQANPDRVVLMQNSATQYLVKGLEDGEYQGDLHIEVDPLLFYTNLEHVIAAGDLVVMQNDWTDNYN